MEKEAGEGRLDNHSSLGETGWQSNVSSSQARLSLFQVWDSISLSLSTCWCLINTVVTKGALNVPFLCRDYIQKGQDLKPHVTQEREKKMVKMDLGTSEVIAFPHVSKENRSSDDKVGEISGSRSVITMLCQFKFTTPQH